MARPRKLWSYPAGRYGFTVTIREPALGRPLRWDYREGGKRRRPEVVPTIRVRTSAKDAIDPVLEERAKKLCEQKLAELTLKDRPEKARKAIDAETLTVGQAYALFNDPKRAALPASHSGKAHHRDGRTFWTGRLLKDTLWNDVTPADIEGALKDVIDEGKVQTAVKRLQTLRTMTRWLQRKMRIKGLEDPTIGIEAKDLMAGYKPRRPRFTHEQVRNLRAVVPTLKWRSRVFYTLLIPSGTRAVQAREAMRSMLDAKLEPPVPNGYAPKGWISLKPVKGQDEHVTYFTTRTRAEIDAALAGPLAAWEAKYQAGEIKDYPLLPGGREDRNELDITKSVSDAILRREMWGVLKDAGIPKESGDRVGFHAVRRAWSDFMGEKMGSERASKAGGWSDPSTMDQTYRERLRHEALEEARKIQEEDEATA